MVELLITSQSISPITFEYQEYSFNDVTLINAQSIQSTFNPQTDYIEYFIYSLSNNILYSDIDGFPYYKLIDNQISIDPVLDLNTSGFNEGSYNTVYNFLRRRCASTPFNYYYIDEISSDRTEIRLNTTQIPNTEVVFSTNEFINTIQSSSLAYVDFYLDFGFNELIIANNILLDNSNINDPTILIKLYEPLPSQFNLKSQCWVVEKIADSIAYNINITEIYDPTDNNIYLKGPNFNLAIQNQINNSTDYSNYQTLSSTTSSLSQGTGSLNYQLNNILAQTGITINIDYSNYSNFIHFSSAQTRLENFYYKLQLLEEYTYSSSLSTTGSLTGSYYASSSNIIWQSKIDEIITTFDSYEYYLYYSSGSTAWPKTGNTPPYTNYSTTSTSGSNWFISQSVIAEEYDIENNNALTLAIPSYILEDSDNTQFELFVEMIGQMFDNIFVYLQGVTSKYDADNRLTYGVSKDLVADILRDMGITIYQNNFSSNDVYQALIGVTPSGSLYNLPYTTTQYPVPTGSFLDYITTYVTASSTSSLAPTDDINKEQYKRIYHNLPLLLKKKGSVAGLRDLITTYGITDTILRINEFGGKDRNPNSYDNWEDTYNYAYFTSGSSFITSSWVLNTDWNASSDNPQAVEFRFKTTGLPTNTGYYSQSLWSNDLGTTIRLKYTGSGYTTASYNGGPLDPYYQYALLEFIPDAASLNSSASIYLPFYDGGWWSVLINKNGGNFTLYAANKNYDGEDGNVVGFQASSSLSYAPDNWSNGVTSYFGTSSLSGKIFSGSFQEIRYYTQPISKSDFDAYVMNPSSIESSEYLAFRATLGGELYTASVSVHPKVTGSWVTTSSFTSNSTFFTGSGGVYVPNTEVFYFNQVPAGIQNAISDKIKQQNIVLPYSSSNTNIPNSNTLSPFISIQQFPSISSSYTRDIDYVEVGFSPQNEINEDINSQIGYFNIGELIGDPRFQSSSLDYYPDLNALSFEYFEKYESNYDWNDYIRLIKFFDNSLFKMLVDFTPARTGLAAGIIIKNTLLDRNRYRTPQVSTSASLANIGSGSTNIPYIVEDQTITGSIEAGNIEGGNGGSFPNLLGLTSSLFTYSGSVNIDQVWSGSTPSLSGSIPFTESAQLEFYNGQLSGSNLVVTNGNLTDYEVITPTVYTTSSISVAYTYPAGFYASGVDQGWPRVTSSISNYINYDFKFEKTYYLSFTASVTNPVSSGGINMVVVNSDLSFVNGISSGSTAQQIQQGAINLQSGVNIISNYEISGVLPRIFFLNIDGGFSVTPPDNPITISDFVIKESTLSNPDGFVIENDVEISRPSSKYMDVDFTTNAITAVNEQDILSGSATRATVPDSYYTTARIINPRYLGSKNTSPDYNTLGDVILINSSSLDPCNPTTTSTLTVSGSKLPAIDYLTSYFAYTPGGLGNTLAERSGSGNYKIGFLVDELGNIYKPDPSSSGYLPNFYDTFGSNTEIILSPTTGTTINQSEYIVYKPAGIFQTILYTDTGSLGLDYLVSGTYANITFSAVPEAYNSPFNLYVETTGSGFASPGTYTSSFNTIYIDKANGYNTSSYVYTVQKCSVVRAAFSASQEIENQDLSLSMTATLRLIKNNTTLTQSQVTIPALGTTTLEMNYDTLLNNIGDEYYYTLQTNRNSDLGLGKWYINPITSSITISKSNTFTTGSSSKNILTSSINLGKLWGGGYAQDPITGSGFDNPQPLYIKYLDEIRFGGNENQVYTVISSSYSSDQSRFYLFLNNEIPSTTGIDITYFAIRRLIFSVDNLIINSPGTVMGQGLILPKYPSPLLQQNLPSIVENLTNKGLI